MSITTVTVLTERSLTDQQRSDLPMLSGVRVDFVPRRGDQDNVLRLRIEASTVVEAVATARLVAHRAGLGVQDVAL